MSDRISFLTSLSLLGTRFFTWRSGLLIGSDQFGNRYYREKKPLQGRREKRWVIYASEPEATKIPPEWHGWIHYTSPEPLPAHSSFHKSWIKPHLANQTMTDQAYFPPGSSQKGSFRPPATGDYQPWIPPT